MMCRGELREQIIDALDQSFWSPNLSNTLWPDTWLREAIADALVPIIKVEIDKAVAAERDACAKLASDLKWEITSKDLPGVRNLAVGTNVAKAIRERAGNDDRH